MGVKIISWQEIWAIRGKFQGEDDLEELPRIYIRIPIVKDKKFILELFSGGVLQRYSRSTSQ